MGQIVDDLTDQKTDLPVQTKQKHVVEELDVAIKQIEDEMKKSGRMAGHPNPTKPMARSTLAKGPGGLVPCTIQKLVRGNGVN